MHTTLIVGNARYLYGSLRAKAFLPSQTGEIIYFLNI
jgi:hypothetical protein